MWKISSGTKKFWDNIYFLITEWTVIAIALNCCTYSLCPTSVSMMQQQLQWCSIVGCPDIIYRNFSESFLESLSFNLLEIARRKGKNISLPCCCCWPRFVLLGLLFLLVLLLKLDVVLSHHCFYNFCYRKMEVLMMSMADSNQPCNHTRGITRKSWLWQSLE